MTRAKAPRAVARAKAARRHPARPTSYWDRPLRQHVVHAGVFLGICASAYLDHRLGLKDAALWVSLASNGLWIFHG